MAEVSNAHALIRSSGMVRVEFTEELCTSCESQSSLFPFDQMHCSMQMALGSSVRRRLVSPPVGYSPKLETHGVLSWKPCRSDS